MFSTGELQYLSKGENAEVAVATASLPVDLVWEAPSGRRWPAELIQPARIVAVMGRPTLQEAGWWALVGAEDRVPFFVGAPTAAALAALFDGDAQ